MELAEELKVPEDRYEFQVLYGMAETVRKGLKNIAKRIRLYAPYGEMIPGMAYLVRRLLENTSNESFLRQSFVEGIDMKQLLQDPLEILQTKKGVKVQKESEVYFVNEPMVNFTRPETRKSFIQAIASVRKQLGKTYPLFINGKEAKTDDLVVSVNPNNPDEQIGYVHQAGIKEIDEAIRAARNALPLWRDTDPEKRASYLVKAAEIMRSRIYELAVWQILEVGKQWDQAYADVTEAIDFLEFNAREIKRLGGLRHVNPMPGEENVHFYEPKGIAAVIAPWNFPMAISCGMSSAALVTGNPVLFKPSSLSLVIGHLLSEIYREAKLPIGVFNYIPGRSKVMGDYLVKHPGISLIAFTGSMEVGLHIIEKAAEVPHGQENVKKVVCEMGGKNAIIIDDDAELDVAIPQVLNSAFAYQGQKCSACSRVIVLDAVYEKFTQRLVRAAKALQIGPAENPANYLGAVISKEAQKKISEYIEIGKKEGDLIYCSETPQGGYFTPVTIIAGINPQHRIAQEEIFGPVLAVMRVKDFNQALDWANTTSYALTGGVFSRSPEHLKRAQTEFRVGNLYLNRGCTGAMVYRQPFGGSRMSGTGTKAGGQDYLLHFMNPRVVTENTMRRGFVPEREDKKTRKI
jgi:RHH-type proline utilization regulon transcriptional repressor/proline dehydrogenase/delta 1-pyrroline-5-carboxylate dehydrogenase